MARREKNPAPSSASTTNPDVPQGRLKQLWLVYKLTRQADKLVDVWMLVALLGSIAVCALLGLLTGAFILTTLFGIPLGVLGAVVVLSRRADAAMYARAEGQPGGSYFALQGLRRGWNYGDQPVQVDPRTQDLVFRAVGRAGVVLLAEGPTKRVQSLVVQERRRLSRVLGTSVPITVINVGTDEGQTPLRKVSSAMLRLRPELSKDEVSAVSARLRAIGGVRPPIPAGVDPTRVRPDRRASRGR